MSQRADLQIRTGSASVTRIPGKGSKSVIPRDLIPAVGTQAACPLPPCVQDFVRHPDKVMSQAESNQTPRGRASALPTLAGTRRGMVKNLLNQTGSSTTTKSKQLAISAPQKRQLEKEFTTKRQKYMTLKKELAEKQKLATDLYDDVSDLRERTIAAGMRDPGKIEKMSLPRTWEREFSEGACGEQSSYIVTSVVTSEFISSLESRLNEIPNVCLDLCREAMTKRKAMIDWFVDLSQQNPSLLDSDVVKELEDHKNDGQGLEARLATVAEKRQTVISDILQKTSALWSEHESYRNHIKELETSGEGLVRELKEKLRAAIEDLDLETEKTAQLKDRKTLAESQLQKARTKIRELENLVTGNEAKIQQLQGKVTTLENQMKQKEATFEARTKDMHKSVKNSESLVAKTEKQRDSLESRVTELRKIIDTKEAEHNEKIKNLCKQLEETKHEVDTEKNLKCKAEDKIKELNERCAKLEEKSQQLCDLAKNAKDLTAKPADGKHTANEVQLWNELQSLKATLAEKDKKLLQVQQEKEKVISVLQQAADKQDPGSGKDKLAAELVTKTEELRSSTMDCEQLESRLKTAIERSDNSERQLSELQSRLHAQSKEGGKSGWGAHAIELQQQLCDLRANLADLTRHNGELESELIQKQLELEQRDRTMREQSKIIKVRDELIGLMKGQNGPNQKGESSTTQNTTVDQHAKLDPGSITRLVNKQIAAKAEDLEALYKTLESKQLQLLRLEKVVRQMEDDNDRSQATRTKLEKEVAHLRIQLHEKNRDKRYVDGVETLTKNSLSTSAFQGLPKLPVLKPIRSRIRSSQRCKSANSMHSRERDKIPIDNPSAQKLKDLIRAVEIERARGSQISRRVSRSLQRSNPVKNSTELREDLYNWLMKPTADSDISDLEDHSKREFVKHSRAILKGELSRSKRRDEKCPVVQISDLDIDGGSRGFVRGVGRVDTFFGRSDSPNRFKNPHFEKTENFKRSRE